jgi:hypothetical protein
MATVTLNRVLELADKLPDEDQELLLDLLRRRRAEAWRKQLAADIRQARSDYRSGKLKSESVDELITRLHRSIDEG